jgi:hypothetical protein
MKKDMFCVACGSKIKIDPYKEKSLCNKCSVVVDKISEPASKTLKTESYQLISKHGTKLFGSYLTKLYNMCSHVGGSMSLQEWIEQIGFDKTNEAIQYGLLINDEIKHDEEIITEKPNETETEQDKTNDDLNDECETDECEADECEADECEADECEADECEADECETNEQPDYNIDKVDSFNKIIDNNFELSINASVSLNGQKGLIRYYAYGDDENNLKHEDWTTDNIDLFVTPFDKIIDTLKIKMASDTNFGEDNGPLKYHLHINCPHS